MFIEEKKVENLFVSQHIGNALVSGCAVRNFEVIEKRGGLPYVVMWIGKHNLPSVEHYETLPEAKRKMIVLRNYGIRATLLLDLNQAKYDE